MLNNKVIKKRYNVNFKNTGDTLTYIFTSKETDESFELEYDAVLRNILAQEFFPRSAQIIQVLKTEPVSGSLNIKYILSSYFQNKNIRLTNNLYTDFRIIGKDKNVFTISNAFSKIIRNRINQGIFPEKALNLISQLGKHCKTAEEFKRFFSSFTIDLNSSELLLSNSFSYNSNTKELYPLNNRSMSLFSGTESFNFELIIPKINNLFTINDSGTAFLILDEDLHSTLSAISKNSAELLDQMRDKFISSKLPAIITNTNPTDLPIVQDKAYNEEVEINNSLFIKDDILIHA